MSLRIQNNIEAMGAHRALLQNNDKLSKSMERLSSGYRINRAADDAAGLAISERMRAQISGVDQANRNAQDGISMVQTAEGSLDEVHSMLQRVRELAVQFKNGSLSDNDRNAIQTEVNQLASEIERIGSSAEFNGIKVLNAAVTITFQVGANDSDSVGVGTISLGAVDRLGGVRADVGGEHRHLRDRLRDRRGEPAAFDVRRGAEPLRAPHERAQRLPARTSSPPSRASATWTWPRRWSTMTKYQILQQAGTSMLAQANQLPQSVLSLLS